jgi:hypothetical protein
MCPPSTSPSAPTQIIVTCRTEYLEAKGAYRALFTPGDALGGSASSRLQELFVRPFEPSQMREYFQCWTRARSLKVRLSLQDATALCVFRATAVDTVFPSQKWPIPLALASTVVGAGEITHTCAFT